MQSVSVSERCFWRRGCPPCPPCEARKIRGGQSADIHLFLKYALSRAAMGDTAGDAALAASLQQAFDAPARRRRSAPEPPPSPAPPPVAKGWRPGDSLAGRYKRLKADEVRLSRAAAPDPELGPDAAPAPRSAEFAPGAQVWARYGGHRFWPGRVWRVKYTTQRAQLGAARRPLSRLVRLLGEGSFVWCTDAELSTATEPHKSTLAAFSDARRKQPAGRAARAALKQLELETAVPPALPWDDGASESDPEEEAAFAAEQVRPRMRGLIGPENHARLAARFARLG